MHFLDADMAHVRKGMTRTFKRSKDLTIVALLDDIENEVEAISYTMTRRKTRIPTSSRLCIFSRGKFVITGSITFSDTDSIPCVGFDVELRAEGKVKRLLNVSLSGVVSEEECGTDFVITPPFTVNFTAEYETLWSEEKHAVS